MIVSAIAAPMASDSVFGMDMPARLENLASVSHLQYEYSDSTLGLLRERVLLPARLETAVIRRQVDFLAGRLCARRALRASGFEGHAEIATGTHGAPMWPDGYAGSISHCAGLAIAAAGSLQHVSAVGVDVERLMSDDVAGSIRAQVASDEELAMSRFGGMSPETWLTTLFSGKESLFKTLYAGVGRYFDFRDVSATGMDAKSNSFMLKLDLPLSPNHPAGATYPIRFRWSKDVVTTWCVLPA